MQDIQFVSVEEFGRRTSLSTRSVWRLLERRLLPSLKVGRRRIVPLDEGVDALRRLDYRQLTTSFGVFPRGRGVRR